MPALHERWEREGVSSVLDTENAEKKAVEQKQHHTPNQYSDLLRLGISHARHLGRERNGAERKESVYSEIVSGHLPSTVKLELTQSCHNLGFQTKLGLETVGKVGHTTFTIAGDIGNAADVIEHVTTREQKNGD